MVVGHQPGTGGDGRPHILYYGHYDVQPAEPLELWQSPPFEPTLVTTERGERIVARGAVDDKGQVMTWLEALRAWHEVHGRLPVRVSVFLEGEEESGSASLEPFLKANRDELRADVCVVSDTGMWDIDQPAISTMLRGLLYVELKLTGPSRDLHSGMYGGAVPNPLNVLCRVLGQLHDDQGRVQLAGLLRPRARARGGPAVGGAAVRRGGVSRRRRHQNAGRRGRAHDARADLVAADLRHQRPLGAATPAPAPRP